MDREPPRGAYGDYLRQTSMEALRMERLLLFYQEMYNIPDSNVHDLIADLYTWRTTAAEVIKQYIIKDETNG